MTRSAGRDDRTRRLHRAAPGAPPGTLRVDPHAPPPKISYIGYGPDAHEELEVQDPAALEGLRGKHAVTWVNVNGLGDAVTLERVGQTFHLHALALEDVVNVPQRPKVEDYPQHLFAVTRMPVTEGTGTEQVSLCLGEGFLLTFQERPGDCLGSVRERIRQGRPRIRGGGPDYLAYAVLDAVVDSYFPLLDALGGKLEEMEEEILKNPSPEVIAKLHGLKRQLTQVRRVILPVRESVAALVRDESPFVTDDTRIFLRDVLDHSFQLIELVEHYRDIASGLLDLHLTLVSNKMNDIMKVLTIIATIFIPLGFVAGLYGMNFDPEASPWNMPELGWRFGYPFALATMAMVAGAMLLFFRSRGWLR